MHGVAGGSTEFRYKQAPKQAPANRGIVCFCSPQKHAPGPDADSAVEQPKSSSALGVTLKRGPPIRKRNRLGPVRLAIRISPLRMGRNRKRGRRRVCSDAGFSEVHSVPSGLPSVRSVAKPFRAFLNSREADLMEQPSLAWPIPKRHFASVYPARGMRASHSAIVHASRCPLGIRPQRSNTKRATSPAREVARTVKHSVM